MFVKCGDCRFWGKKGEAGQFRQCQAVPHDEDGLSCEYTYPREHANNYHLDGEELAQVDAYRAAHKAVVKDGSGYFAALKVRDDFGCVLFSPSFSTPREAS